MRISTSGMHAQALAAMLLEQGKLAKVQQQLTTGQRLTRAADDPSAASSGLIMDQALAELTRHGENAKRLTSGLQAEESALDSSVNVLQRIQELAVQVNNGAYGDTERKAISAELHQRYDELVGIANSGDGSGRFLFGGTTDGRAPFTQGAGGVTYNGDQGQRLITVAPGVDIADGDAGSEVFLRVPGGTDVFAAVRNLMDAVDITGNAPAAEAARQAGYATAQGQLGQALNHVTVVRSTIGTRLSTLETAESQREAAKLDVQSALSGLRDTDYTEAVSRMNLLMTALQAAQQTYQKVQGHSLFDYLR